MLSGIFAHTKTKLDAFRDRKVRNWMAESSVTEAELFLGSSGYDPVRLNRR